MLGMTPLEMLLGAVGAKDDPNSGGRQMPSHWGHKRLNIVSQSSPTGTQCLHAIGTAEAGRLYETVTSIEGRESRYQTDEVTYVSIGEGTTSEGEFWESLNSACTLEAPGRLRDRGQRLRDLGAGRSADARRRHLEARRLVPRPLRPEHRRHRLPRELQGDDGRRRLRARAQGSGVRPRQGHPPLLALAVGRREAVQDGGRARRGSQARSDYAARGVPRGRGHRERSRAQGASSARSRRRSTRPPTPAIKSEKPARDTADALRLLARRRSDVTRLQHRRPRRKASPTRWSRRSTAR